MIDRKLKLPGDWSSVILEEYDKEYFVKLRKKLLHDYCKYVQIRPCYKDIFNAFKFCSLENLKVVILGQDPYHNENQAHGLAFSVPLCVKIPPSLDNIFNELSNDLGVDKPKHGNLEKWADQGVLLLNSFLTVELHKPLSHSNIGWDLFTDAIISKISDLKHHVVFILWGNYAKSKKNLVDQHKHCVLTAAHPSPMSVSRFYGCRHFSKTNKYLIENNIPQIDWSF